MEYLADTDTECAELKADVARTEYIAKLKEAVAFKVADGNIEERKAIARSSGDAQTAWDAHFSAIRAYEIVRAKRERAVLVVDVWRTTQANRRKAA
jgi:hypothetical protein